MKKTAFILLTAMIALASVQALAAEESEYYFVNVPIVKLYATLDGYIATYKVGSTELGTAYLPIRWFVPGGKGASDLGWGPAYPYMSVYYKAGKFDHVVLHLNADQADGHWGPVSQYADTKDLFEGVEEVKLKF